MHRVECSCGKVLYRDVRYCPKCGRRLVEKPDSLKSVNKIETNNKE